MRAPDQPVRIPAAPGRAPLPGLLGRPEGARGLVLFAHGSGSSRLGPRNRTVAEGLRVAGFATLLFDLLTEAEALDRANVFDIPLLAGRVVAAADWAGAALPRLPLGLFGASTGAAAALVAAAERPGAVRAVVSRGGRPDLAGAALAAVRAPTLLIVGEADPELRALNEAALAELDCTAELRIIPGAGHLFEEPGALETVIAHAADWFAAHLGPPAARG